MKTHKHLSQLIASAVPLGLPLWASLSAFFSFRNKQRFKPFVSLPGYHMACPWHQNFNVNGTPAVKFQIMCWKSLRAHWDTKWELEVPGTVFVTPNIGGWVLSAM